MKNIKAVAFSALSFLLVFVVNSQTNLAHQSEELGKVHWYRDYDKAVAMSKEQSKDILILFQEVPGCATCRNYGKNVLSNPLLVEAIENEFIPLAIFNNKKGEDREILNKFNEPTWNNPAVRIVNSKGRNLIQRIYGDYSTKTLLNGMISALESYGKSVPKYISLLQQEFEVGNNTKEKHFQMYCFWSGEKQLGKVEGVLNTESGFMNHAEVVKVTYDSDVVSEAELEKYAKANSFRPVDENKTYRVAQNDVHYYLRHTDYKYIPLTTLQQTKINSALGNQKSGLDFLSPKQHKWLKAISKSKKKPKSVLNVEFTTAWKAIQNDKLVAQNSK